jgi:hypothetical protein
VTLWWPAKESCWLSPMNLENVWNRPDQSFWRQKRQRLNRSGKLDSSVARCMFRSL